MLGPTRNWRTLLFSSLRCASKRRRLFLPELLKLNHEASGAEAVASECQKLFTAP